MAPPISKRSKQNSPTSPRPPIPLPGIAVGLFAAIAAGFAASRALRRKRPAQSSQEEHQPISTGEIEVEGRDANSILISANGTITIAQGPSKPAAGLKPVFDAFEKVPCVQKRDAQALEEGEGGDEEEKGEEAECGNGHNEGAENGGGFEKVDKEEEPVENGEATEEAAEIFVKIEASLTVDGTSVEALQSSCSEIGEHKAEEETETEGKGKDREDSGVINDKGLSGDGYGDKNFVDQQPSPVLINGTSIDFCEGMPAFQDGPADHLSNGSNSLSDAISESSVQEVSSVPVKPFVCTEETPQAKPGFTEVLNQTGQGDAFQIDKNWASEEQCLHPLEDGLSETRKEVPEFAENLVQLDGQFIDLKHGQAILNDDRLDLKLTEHDVDVGLLDLKPVLMEIDEKKLPDDKVKHIRVEMLSDAVEVNGNSIAFEGKVSNKEIGLEEGVAEPSKINGKVLAKPDELDDVEAIVDCEHGHEATGEVADDVTGLPFKGETIVESVQISGKVLLSESPNEPCIFQVTTPDETSLQTGQKETNGGLQINGKVLLDESLNEPCVLKGMTPDETSLQKGQKETDGIISDIHGEPDLLPAHELSGNGTRVTSEDDLHGGESEKEVGCVGSDAVDEHVIVEGILEEPELQPATQELDDVDGTNTNAEDSLELGKEQSSLFIASKGITEGDKLSREGNTDNVDRETVVKDRIHGREQEIEEITRPCDANDLVCEELKLTSLTDSVRVAKNTTRDADYVLLKGDVHQHGLQPKGVSVGKILEYLPLEIGLICLLIALVSSVLWYLKVLPSISL